jgi:hypothetical protein
MTNKCEMSIDAAAIYKPVILDITDLAGKSIED